ncbi:MAG TPA: glycosyltransferase family 87 protein [Pirellulales bacterium]|nr:glycosyltransferase family 87 protein [Pirellulales bacterium]
MAVGRALVHGNRTHTASATVARRTWYAWLIFACVLAAVVARMPDYRTVTPNYRDACHHWFEGKPIYAEGVHGFLYFPHAAILFAPFTYLPSPLGDLLWRALSIGSLAAAVWRTAELITPAGRKNEGMAFALMTCLAIPLALASARNGQMNLMLTALTTFALVDLSRERWRAGACWLCLGAAVKPLMVVPMAVAAVVYRPVLRPLAFGALVLVAAPFLTQHPGYVWEQYRICAQKILLAGNPGNENPASDLFGLLAAMGYAVPLTVQTTARLVAGAATIGLALVTVQRRDAGPAALSVLALAACYLALFNPRMENNGYVVLSPTIGALAADALLYRRRPAMGWFMVAAALGIAGNYEIVRGYNFWLCPLLATLVWAYVLCHASPIPLGKFSLSRAAPDVAG